MSLRIGNCLQRSLKTGGQIRYAHVIADGRGPCYEPLNSFYKVNFTNPECEIPPEKLDYTTVKKYKFPAFTLKYSFEDCVQHALSVGVDKDHPNAEKLLKTGANLEVLPSFPLMFGNYIMINMEPIMFKGVTLHGEQLINIYQPLKPQDEIIFKLDVADVVNKGTGILSIFNMNGTDKMGNKIFHLEYQFFEVGASNIGAKRIGIESEKIVSPPNSAPDKIFVFKTVESSSNVLNTTLNDKSESLYSVKHPKQHYAVNEKFSSQPNCHGRYYLGAVIQQILGFYGSTKLFKRVKTRFSNLVYPGDTLVTKCWKVDNRIHFETFVNENGKCVLQGSYLDLKASLGAD